MSKYYLSGTALAALLLATTPALAQQTTGALKGNVSSDSGAPIAGAQVTVLHAASGTRFVTVTDAEGNFDARGLRVGGPFTLIVKAQGKADRQITDVYVTVGDVQNYDLTLESNNQVEALVVRGTKKDKISSPGSRTRLRRDDIEAIPSQKRDIRDFGRRDPLASLDFVNRGTGPSGGLYIAGSTPRSNLITIDGVRSQDDYGINTGGLSTNRGPISPEAVEQFTVQAVPFDVSQGDYTGGGLNMVLRSGSNDFHGSVFIIHRDNDLVGHKIPRYGQGGAILGYNKLTNKIDEKNYGAFVSGPIFKDKLFFALSYEKFETTSVVQYGPSGQGFANPLNGLGGAGTQLSQADIDGVLNIWRNSYAAGKTYEPGGVPLTRPILDEKYSAKIDWNINDQHRASATYRHAYSSVWKPQINATNVSMVTNWYAQPENEDNYSVELNSNWNPQLTTEARLSYRNYQRGQMPPLGQNFSQIKVCTDPVHVAGAKASDDGYDNNCAPGRAVGGSSYTSNPGQPVIAFGPDQFRQANVLKTKNLSGNFSGTYRLGNHSLKAGYQFKSMDIYNLFVVQARGTYYFDSIADFQSGTVGAIGYGNALTGDPRDGAAKFRYTLHSLFAQDSWDINREFSLNYGLRYDFYKSDSKPALNPNFVSRYGFNNQQNFDGLAILQPRISAKYDNGDFQVSGGIGLVSGGLPDVFLGNRYSNTGILTNAINLRRNADGTATETNSNTLITDKTLLQINPNDPTFGSKIPSAITSLISTNSAALRLAETNSLAPNFEMPSDWKANLSFRTIMLDTRLGFDFVGVRSNNGLAFRDLRARRLTVNGVQQYTPDGRIRYDGLTNLSNDQRIAQGLPTSTNPDLVNLGGARDIQAYNPDQASWSQTFAFSAGRTFFNRLDVNGSYTINRNSLFGGLPEFATIESDNYGEQYTSFDPNSSVRGKASNTIANNLKLSASYKFEVKPGWETRITLFGEQRSGRPLNFTMQDGGSTSARGQSFGVTRAGVLAFVPDMASADTSDPNLTKFTTNGVVVYMSPADAAAFKNIVNTFNLKPGVQDKGNGRNPSVNRIDLQIAQNIPTPIRGHKLLLTVDFINVGNMLNRKWGVVREFSDGRATGSRITDVYCADALGNAAASNSPVCTSYLFKNASKTITTPIISSDTVWSVQMGLKYSF